MNTTMCLPRLAPGLAVIDAKITCHCLGRPTEGQAGHRLPGRGTARVAASISASASSATVERTWPKADRNFQPGPRLCPARVADRPPGGGRGRHDQTSRVKPKDDQ